MCYMTYFITAMHFMAMSVATRINFLGQENFCMCFIASTLPLHADRFDVLHDLHFMAMSGATKVNFLGLDNFYMLHISFSLPLHANRFDVPHDLL